MSLPLAQCYAIMIESMPLPVVSALPNANVNTVEAPMHAVKEQQDRSETRAPSRDNSYKEMLRREASLRMAEPARAPGEAPMHAVQAPQARSATRAPPRAHTYK